MVAKPVNGLMLPEQTDISIILKPESGVIPTLQPEGLVPEIAHERGKTPFQPLAGKVPQGYLPGP